jgi:hypothetical protein
MANKKLPIQIESDNFLGMIEKKVDKETFHWAVGIIVGIIITIISGAFVFIFKYYDTITDINEKIARIETKLDDMKHP